MTRRLLLSLALLLLPSLTHGAALPGFGAQPVASTAGFATSIAMDSRGILYYTTTRGGLFRLDQGQSTRIAQVETEGIGNAGLLGLALADDRTAVVHYTTPMQTHHVISSIDLTTGAEQVRARLVSDITTPGRPVSTEHHGGNPVVAPDGSIFVGIGDFGGFVVSQDPRWIAGKILRIRPNGQVEQFALGFRNPFDIAWDDARQQLIVPDNGEERDDEINVVTAGGNYGWPYGMGQRPGLEGHIAPVYTFPDVVVPTGIVPVNGHHRYLKGGYILGSFVARTLFYIPDMEARPLPDPVRLLEGETGVIIDVAQAPDGEIYFTTGGTIFRLIAPTPGDCNGDGLLDLLDRSALDAELTDGIAQQTLSASEGNHRGSWGCDANTDGMIDPQDRIELIRTIPLRGRVVRGRG
ncbi:MAG TPA: PQQ-dependent sugar dehydrogenase [Thermoanaerobaculia bacterium]|nr:PQQ-dependent sugar dehydrogenase [Thermoanaerobaculia bacterium]